MIVPSNYHPPAAGELGQSDIRLWHCKIDVEVISNATISELREKAAK